MSHGGEVGIFSVTSAFCHFAFRKRDVDLPTIDAKNGFAFARCGALLR